MAREPHGGLGDGVLRVQAGTEALQETEARRDRARGQRVTEGGFEPGIHIRGGRLRQVMRERGLARLRHEDEEVFEGAARACLHRRTIATRTYIDHIVLNKALVLRTHKVERLRCAHSCRAGVAERSSIPLSFSIRHGVLPVEDRELSIDCLHNH